MKKKMNFKSFLIVAVIYGVLMGVSIYITTEDIIISTVLGIVSGFLFSLLMFVFFKIVEKIMSKKGINIYDVKSTEKLRNEIEAKREIIYDDLTSHMMSKMLYASGWMFLTEDALEFYKTKFNLGGNNIAILLDNIVSTSIKSKKILIRFAEKQTSIHNEDIWTKHETYWKMG